MLIKCKKMLSALLTFSLVAAQPLPSLAASPVRLNEKSLTLSQGKTAVLKVISNKKVKWSCTDSSIVKIKKYKKNKIKIKGIRSGKTTIIAKTKNSKAKCNIRVTSVKKNTVLYDLKKERGKNPTTGKSLAPPIVCSYENFRYNSYAVWICPFPLYDPSGNAPDMRGQKLKIKLTIQNTGTRDLPELGVCFNYENGESEKYPFALHVSSQILPARIRSDERHKNTAFRIQHIEKGKTYTWTFTYTIPRSAQNPGTAKNSTGTGTLPITMYISNLRDEPVYQPGDEITIRKCVITKV